MRIPKHIRRHAGLMVSMMAITTADGAMSVLLPSMLHQQGKDPATVGALVATLAVTALLIRLPGGFLYSETRAPRLMMGALALSALMASLFPLTSSAGLLALVGAAYGAGYSMSTTVNMALFVGSLGDDPHRNQVVSLYAGSTAFGYALGSLGGGVVANWFGFKAAFLLASVACLAGLAIVGRNRSIGKRQANPAAAVPSSAVTARGLGRVARDPLVLFIVSGAFFINVFLAQFNTFTPLTLLPLGMALAQVGAIRSVWSLTNAVGRSFSGSILSRLGARRAQTGGLLFQAVMLMLFALRLPFGAYMLLTVAAASGRAIGYVANTVALTQVNPQQLSRGLASGIMNAAGDLGKIVGPVAGGLIARQVGLNNFWLIAPPLFAGLYLLVLGLSRNAGRGLAVSLAAAGNFDNNPAVAADAMDESPS